MNERQEDGTTIYYDISSIELSKNLVFYGTSKHIKIRYHFIRELVENRDIKIEFCKCKQYLVDIFTKPLGKDPCCFGLGQGGIVGILIVIDVFPWSQMPTYLPDGL